MDDLNTNPSTVAYTNNVNIIKSSPTPIEELTQEGEVLKVIRKVDWRLLPVLSLMYTLSLIDRGNIGLARLYGLEEELELTPHQYGLCLSIFFIGYTLFEIPSNLLLKKLSPPRWFSVILVVWGGSTMCLAAATDFNSLVTLRFFLGVAEAGLFPGILFYISYWYPRRAQGTKIAIFNSVGILVSSANGLLVYFIAHLEGAGGMRAWKWIFLLEGLPSILLGLCTWFLLPNKPQEAKFLNSQEKSLLVEHLQDNHVQFNLDHFDRQQFYSLLKDPKIYLFMLSFFGLLISGNTSSLLFPTLIRSFGFSSLTSSLLTVPPNFVGALVSILVAWHSDRKVERSIHIISCTCVAILGFVLVQCSFNIYLNYFSLILVSSGVFSSITLVLSWLNNNLLGSTISALAPPAVVMSGSLGGFVAGQLYFPSDAPAFRLSHNLNIASLLISIVCVITLRWMMYSSNRRLDKAIESTKKDLPPSTFRYIL